MTVAATAVAWPGLQLRISVDGLEQTHDRMRGVEGSWKLVTKTVREVAELKAELVARGLDNKGKKRSSNVCRCAVKKFSI